MFAFWVLGGGDGVTFWSHGKPLRSRKWPLEEAQPVSRMVCVATTRREEWGMVWVDFQKRRQPRKDFLSVLHFLILMTI